ncbi:MAG TPA: hypothetical protein VEW69_02690 [Alphaproteobacteria bacterium]|nr:hypothetical protein [Alphaproteobacteria bacterium]
MRKMVMAAALVVLGSVLLAQSQPSQPSTKPATWNFAVSGDSRNCGDVVMPAIAAGAAQGKAAFYWHLGDLRATYKIDEDYQQEPEHRGQPADMALYLKSEWDDFIQSQIKPFRKMPFIVGIGNHEVVAPMTREMFIAQFADWLNSSAQQKQRLADNPEDHRLKAYFHWIQGGVDFIYLDNATHDQFDADQVRWFEDVVLRAAADSKVKSLVVGMHAALPDSLASGHSMNDWDIGAESGRRVYLDLLDFQRSTKKPVYILASHSHFYMRGIYDSDAWQQNGGVLPGWITGTAGAVRYVLPPSASRAQEKRENAYGFLLATVHQDGKIDFRFQEVQRPSIPAKVVERYTPELVDWCFVGNTEVKKAK